MSRKYSAVELLVNAFLRFHGNVVLLVNRTLLGLGPEVFYSDTPSGTGDTLTWDTAGNTAE